MRSEEMRQSRRLLVIVILSQASLISAPGHWAPDSATCRTAASNARSARVAMALRSSCDPLINLSTERLDPIWVQTANDDRHVGTDAILFGANSIIIRCVYYTCTCNWICVYICVCIRRCISVSYSSVVSSIWYLASGISYIASCF